ncbi:TPA: 4Fe-4S dicluster domain-containing protein [Candidatus Poribacteria bacterium]|nr:4Fe-4S dicluster domain-containing protein [Candidatus Poribacteria bacterium]
MDLSVEICGLKFKTPIMPAAGPTVRNGDSLIKVAKGGAGGLVSKTLSDVPARVPRPCLIKVRESLMNAELWSDLSLEQWLKHELPKAKETGLPLIVSIGYTAEDVRKIAPKVAEVGADALELSTHHLSDVSTVTDAIKAAKEAVKIPVFVKVSPNVVGVAQFVQALEEAGADGIVAINAIGPCLAIDVENAMPMLGSPHGYGWLSGPAIKPFAVRYVAEIARAVKIPVIGSGGISTGRDAVEHIMAGALAVQVSTVAIIRGPKIYGLLADEMAKFMRAKGYNSINDFRGIALRHLSDQPLRTTPKPVEIIASRCNACGLCERYCIYEAIRIMGKVAKVDPVKCYECGLCVSVCPTRAVRF